MVKIFPRVAGNTLDCHKKFLKKLRQRGVKVTRLPEKSKATIVFCPIVSRFETDINSALASVPEGKKIILVAMHHTFDPNCVLPSHSQPCDERVILLVNVLFHETAGLLSCPCNKNATKRICKELKVRKRPKIPAMFIKMN